MTKAEFVTSIAEKADLTKTSAEKAVSAFIETVTECLQDGDKITLVGFGTFCTAERAAREGQNPQTGKKIEIPAATVPKFKAGKTLKDAVNN